MRPMTARSDTAQPALQRISRPYLYLLVFTAGFSTLGVELSASRLLDPWFGNSLVVWASLIGLILFYLAVGYWLGGRIADRWPDPLVLLRITATGAFGVGLIPALSRPVLRLASGGLDTFDVGLLGGSMAAILVLFAVPVTLLGCVSPFAIRLGIKDVEGSGEVAGRDLGALDGGQHPGQLSARAPADPRARHPRPLRCCASPCCWWC